MKRVYLISLFLQTITFSVFAQYWQWGKEASSPNGSEAWAAAIDRWNNAYLVGGFAGNLYFGSLKISTGWEAVSLIKCNSNGTAIWARQDSSVSSTYIEGLGVSTDNKGNVYATGGFGGEVFFDTIKLIDYPDIDLSGAFLVKYDSSGNVIWAKQSMAKPYSSHVQANAVAVDDSNHIYIVGESSYNTLYFGKDSIVGGTYFITKYDSVGNVLWAKGAQRPIWAKGVATDKVGNIYVTGYFVDSCMFDTVHLVGGYNSTFIVKYNSSGHVLWGRAATGFNRAFSVTTYNNEEYVTGYFSDSSSFGSLILPKPAYQDFFLVKYNNAGNVLWAKEGGIFEQGDWTGYSVATDNTGVVYCALGAWSSTFFHNWGIAFGADTLRTIDNETDGASAIIEFDSTGHELCGSIIPGGGDDGNALAVDPTGQYVYFGGDIADTIICGPDTLPYEANEAEFIARWQPCKSYESINNIVNSENDINIFPNPSNGKFTIEAQGIRNKEYIETYNILGEKVYRSSLSAQRTALDLTGQPSGIYLYCITTEKGELLASGKLVIN